MTNLRNRAIISTLDFSVGRRSFFYALFCSCLRVENSRTIANEQTNKMEVEVVRTRVTLECTECKQRNYNMTKDKKTHPERMETKKYCKFCKKHTLHKETK